MTIKTLKEYYTCTVIKTIEEDSFNGGCIVGTFQDFGVIETFKASTLTDIVKLLESNYGQSPSIFEDETNRLEIQRTENKEGYQASSTDLIQFKEGGINLWAATYSCYIEKIMANDELLDEFKSLNLETI
jgi:hypothetical protein